MLRIVSWWSTYEKAILVHFLELLYQARCNLFHGQKAYSEVQRPLLEGMIEVLVVTIEQVRASLRNRATEWE